MYLQCDIFFSFCVYIFSFLAGVLKELSRKSRHVNMLFQALVKFRGDKTKRRNQKDRRTDKG